MFKFSALPKAIPRCLRGLNSQRRASRHAVAELRHAGASQDSHRSALLQLAPQERLNKFRSPPRGSWRTQAGKASPTMPNEGKAA
jgi:hypothetical protein